MRFRLAVLLALGLTLGWMGAAVAAVKEPAVLVVSPQGPFTTIQAALAAAGHGDTLEVHPGVYAGPLVVDKSVRLSGVDWPVIDGGGDGTVVSLNAPGIQFEGFEVRNSGVEPDRDHAGITLTASDIRVENNRLRDVLFGIFVAQADGAVLRSNDITSKEQFEVGRRGDGIRLWYSQNVLVEDNHVHAARDLVMWYANDVIVRDNRIEDGRYGVHLMYCNRAQILGNQLRGNSVGIYTMYSDDVLLRQNDIRQTRGPSGYALGFKDADRVEVNQNLLVDNRGGVLMDGTPFRPGGYARLTENIFAYNDIAIILFPSVRGATFADNTFWENVEQVSIGVGAKPGDNTWQANYWSDYTGFDVNGDNQGEQPYHSERFFESLTDQEPLLRVLIYSPAAQAIEFAATSFPIFKPQPKFTDAAPRLAPAELPESAVPEGTTGQRAGMALAGLGLLLTSAIGLLAVNTPSTLFRWNSSGVCALPMNHRIGIDRARRGGNRMHTSDERGGMAQRVKVAAPPLAGEATPVMLQVEGLSKRYGRLQALDRVSFQARAGEAVALWGSNGAGKTTLLKAMLGLVDYQGTILVAGLDGKWAGKAARSNIGYVPQEALYYDMSVRATISFYARLRQADAGRIPTLLSQLGLNEHARKPVQALSGGLKQRLALAIALLSDPPVLLLDEPTANLDANTRRDYLSFLLELRRQQKTILFASHRLDEVEVLADRVLLMEAGRIIQEFSTEQMRRRLASDIELVLWVAEDQRRQAVQILEGEGLAAHVNGRGTVVVRLDAAQKMRALHLLEHHEISVLDFETEKEHSWN